MIRKLTARSFWRCCRNSSQTSSGATSSWPSRSCSRWWICPGILQATSWSTRWVVGLCVYIVLLYILYVVYVYTVYIVYSVSLAYEVDSIGYFIPIAVYYYCCCIVSILDISGELRCNESITNHQCIKFSSLFHTTMYSLIINKNIKYFNNKTKKSKQYGFIFLLK